MGRAPQEKVYKKLIGKYLKFNIGPSSVKPDSKLIPKLLASYNKHGFDHPECNLIKNQLNEQIEMQQRQLSDLKKEISTYPSLVEKFLYNVKHKGEKRGKNNVPADFYGEIQKEKDKLDI